MQPITAPQTLDERLADLLAADRFVPPATFAERAHVRDRALHDAARADRLAYWARRAEELDWVRPFTETLDDHAAPHFTWFADGTLNASANCLDRHIEEGLADRVAYHWHGEEGEARDVTYGELHEDVQRLANGLLDLGVRPGDVVGIYLPMIPEVVVAMLACARIGAPHNVVFGGFSAESVRERMEASDAKVLITADGARRKGKTAPVKAEVDRVMGDLPALEHVVVVPHTGIDAPMAAPRDVDYRDLLAGASPDCPAVGHPAEHPLFILYSSGSTAKPKGILHTTGGYLTGVSATMADVFDLRSDEDVWFCTADVGWITGHSYAVYGPLMRGATSIMYEGAPDYPHQGIWWELVERHGATILYTAPTAIRACMKWGAEHPERFDLTSLRLLATAGEPINPKAWLWFHEVIGGGRCPIADTWWQTETGHVMVTTLPGLDDAKPGSAGKPIPGVSVRVVDEDGRAVPEGEGLLVIDEPWPGMLRGLFGDDDRYRATYWARFGAGTYLVGDAARLDGDGYLWILGRTDDVINVSGHRLSTAQVESVIVAHEDVAEAAVVAQSDPLTGQAILAFVTLRTGVREDGVDAALNALVAERIGKFARPKRIVFCDDLPKTRSGKIMRRLLRDLAEGRELGDVTTLRDPAPVQELAVRMQAG